MHWTPVHHSVDETAKPARQEVRGRLAWNATKEQMYCSFEGGFSSVAEHICEGKYHLLETMIIRDVTVAP